MYKLREMTSGDQDKIAEWRSKWHTTTRQLQLPTLEHYKQKQREWFEKYDRNMNHYFVLIDSDNPFVPLGVTALTNIDRENQRAEIHHYIGHDYINQVTSTHSINLIMDYAYKILGLHSVWVETLESDMLKFKFFEDYGFKHIGTWPHKNYKPTEIKRDSSPVGNQIYQDVNILVHINKF